MSKEIYLIIAISILVALLLIFFITFIIYRRTPVPKGCENLKINEENCSTCENSGCPLKNKGEE